MPGVQEKKITLQSCIICPFRSYNNAYAVTYFSRLYALGHINIYTDSRDLPCKLPSCASYKLWEKGIRRPRTPAA